MFFMHILHGANEAKDSIAKEKLSRLLRKTKEYGMVLHERVHCPLRDGLLILVVGEPTAF